MADRQKVIKGLECCVKHFGECKLCPYGNGFCNCDCGKQLYADALTLLKEQEPVEPHCTKLEYMVNGMPYVVHHAECPRCIENGLTLWDAEIEKGATYCKRCGQAVKWDG